MSTIFHVAFLVMCFNGDCIRFESVPYSHNISHEQCMKMLEYTFKTQVGPYYDEVIDFEQSVPADLTIRESGCDVTDRRPEDFDGKDWRIELDSPVHGPPIQDQNDLKWQQQQEHNIE